MSADSQIVVLSSISELFEIQKQLSKAHGYPETTKDRSYNFWGFLKEWHCLNFQ